MSDWQLSDSEITGAQPVKPITTVAELAAVCLACVHGHAWPARHTRLAPVNLASAHMCHGTQPSASCGLTDLPAAVMKLRRLPGWLN